MQSFYIIQDIDNAEIEDDYDYEYDDWVDYQDWLEQSWD
jgi:hypothetical protein